MRHICVGITVGALLVAAGLFAPAQEKPRPAREARGGDSALLKHGEYLVTSLVLCGDCHTPRDKKGQPYPDQLLQGSTLPIRPKKETKHWMDMAPDVTRGGLAGMWSESDMVKFLMTGTDPEGKKALPPMPPFRMSRHDACAVAVYLRSLPGKKKR
jgi:mono/diheme cytochrome c family protein